MDERVIEELLQYKRLLDEEIITRDEFEEKKRSLLNEQHKIEEIKEEPAIETTQKREVDEDKNENMEGRITPKEYFALGGHDRKLYRKEGNNYVLVETEAIDDEDKKVSDTPKEELNCNIEEVEPDKNGKPQKTINKKYVYAFLVAFGIVLITYLIYDAYISATQCTAEECTNKHSKDCNYCDDHTCKSKGCKEYAYKGYCEKHKCEQCQNQKVEGSEYCTDHINCWTVGCDSPKEEGKNYCSSHLCIKCGTNQISSEGLCTPCLREKQKAEQEAAEREAKRDLVTIDYDGKKIWRLYMTGYTFTYTGSFRGSGNYIVVLKDSNQDHYATIVNEIGDYDVNKTVRVTPGYYYLERYCSRGSWSASWSGTYGQ